MGTFKTCLEMTSASSSAGPGKGCNSPVLTSTVKWRSSGAALPSALAMIYLIPSYTVFI